MGQDCATGASPFCFACGYSMVGLELPRPCPECGVLVDPPAQVEAARRWAVGRGPWWWLLRRSRTVPPALLYVLTDPVSIRVARRRAFLALWLPAILTALVVFMGSAIVVDYEVTIRYHLAGQLDAPPVYTETKTRSERLFHFNFYLDGLFMPANWVPQEGSPENRSIRIERPAAPDPLAAILGGLPFFALGLAYAPGWCLLILLARRRGRRRACSDSGVAAKTAIRTLSLPGAFAAWLWLIFVLAFGMGSCPPFSEAPAGGSVLAVLAGTAITVYAVTMCLGWWRLVHLDRADKVFPARAVLALILMLMSLAGSIASVWLLVTMGNALDW
ncbi:MAG: hypothetical protein GXY55_15735 [Phycisphaerae bacterium]|nr:hypothetical protein [Phycisphaerae bacterium]